MSFAVGLQARATMLALWGCWELNSSPHACKVSTLLTKPPHGPQTCLFSSLINSNVAMGFLGYICQILADVSSDWVQVCSGHHNDVTIACEGGLSPSPHFLYRIPGDAAVTPGLHLVCQQLKAPHLSFPICETGPAMFRLWWGSNRITHFIPCLAQLVAKWVF